MTVSFIITEPGLSPGVVAGIVVLLLLMAAAAAAGVVLYCNKTSELKNQKCK